MNEQDSIPLGWVITTIEELCHLINGRAFKPEEWKKSGLPIVRIQNLNDLTVGFNYCDKPVEEKFYINTGELLFAWSGTPGTSFGCHIWTGGRAVLNQHIFRVLIDETKINKRFFQLAINQVLDILIDKAHGGVGLRHVTKGKFEETEVFLPPLNEQRRIVAKIDALFARSRRAREYLAAIPPLLEKFRQSVLAAAFRGDLTKEWREKNKTVEPASVLLERIRAERRNRWEETELTKMRAKGREPLTNDWKAKYVEPEPVDTSDLPELPDGWEWASLLECSKRITDGTHQPPKFTEDGIPFVFVQHIVNGEISFEGTKFISKETYEVLNSRCPVEVGDILYSAVGSYGVAVPVLIDKPFSFQRHIAHIKPIQLLNHSYLTNCLNSSVCLEQADKAARGIAQKTVTLGDLSRYVIPIAPLLEQKIITEIIKKYFFTINKLEIFLENSLERVQQLNQSILAKAFRGELVPQDPNDEPASVLLERIRAERAASETAKLNSKQTKINKGKEEKMHKGRVRSQESEQANITTNAANDEENGRAMVQRSLFE